MPPVTLAASGRQLSDALVTETWFVAGLGAVRSFTRQLSSPVMDGALIELQFYRVGSQRSESEAPTLVFQTHAHSTAVVSARAEVIFSEELDPESGGDAALAVVGADNLPLAGPISWDRVNKTLSCTPKDGPRQGSYRVVLSPTLTDLVGPCGCQPGLDGRDGQRANLSLLPGTDFQPEPAEPEPNRSYDSEPTLGEVSDHGCDGSD